MNTDDLETRTVQNYSANASLWTSSHAHSYWIWAVQRLKELLPSGKVLEIGCGGGRDAAELIAAGYDYMGTDAAAGMIAVAQTQAPGGDFRQLSLYDLDKLRTKFDGFWACNVLLHIPKARIGEALDTLNRTLRQDAVGFIVLKDGDREEFEVRDKDNRHEERLFVYWGKDEFVKTLADHGFGVIEYSYKHVDERTSQHIFFVRKEKDA